MQREAVRKEPDSQPGSILVTSCFVPHLELPCNGSGAGGRPPHQEEAQWANFHHLQGCWAGCEATGSQGASAGDTATLTFHMQLQHPRTYWQFPFGGGFFSLPEQSSTPQLVPQCLR